MAARISIELAQNELDQIISELELSNPPSFTLNHSGKFARDAISVDGKVRGSFDPTTNHVTVTTQGESYEKEGLYVLTKHIRFTVLHELRHAWQREHWTEEQKIHGRQGPYHLRPEEIDANAWADYASGKFRLVKVTRQQVGRSGLSRLSERERQIKPT